MLKRYFFLTLILLGFVYFKVGADQSPATPQGISVITINDQVIGPIVAEYIDTELSEAEAQNKAAVVIELDTPGGLLSSTHLIVKKIMSSKVPVITYVSPTGGRAASAGVFITLASHIAAMAPSTNIGAAHPVELGEAPKNSVKKKNADPPTTQPLETHSETENDDIMSEKILNDTVAWVTGLARTRHRNVDWAIRSVTESISSTEVEAAKLGVIDVVAKDVPELLKKIEGRVVQLESGEIRELHLSSIDPTKDLERNPFPLRLKVMEVLLNPNLAYILMILGFYGLLFEITHPGMWFPGVAGIACLILAFYAFHSLPTNYAGVAMIFLAIVLFVAEAHVVSYGFLTIGGLVCMLLGSLFLIQTKAAFLKISMFVIVPSVVSTAAVFLFLVTLAVRAQKKKEVHVGITSMVGREATVLVPLPKGKVFVAGEIWQATCDEVVEKGEKVEVVSVDGMSVRVRKKPDYR